MYQLRNVYFICAFAAIGGGLFGFDISSMSGVIGTDAYSTYFHVAGGYRQGAITCAMPAGSLFGALASSFIADRYSRIVAIQCAALVWIVGSILQSASQGIEMLIVGRIIAGLGVGVESTIVPVYQAEVAPPEIRGRVVSLQQWAITWGILVQYFVQYGASFSDGGPNNPAQGTAAFRIPWGVQTIPAAILFVGMFFFPRSPRWLAAQDRWEEAIQVIANLHGGGDMNHPKVLAQYQEIEEALTLERVEGKTDWAALIEPRMLRRVVLGMSVQMWSQLCGMNVMMYYIVYVMDAAGVSDPLLTASIQYILNVVLTLPAILFLDKWGRRPSLLVGSFFMMLFLLVVGCLEGIYGRPFTAADGPLGAISWILRDNRGVTLAVVVFSYLFVGTFSITWGPTSWTYPAEIFPSQVRAKAVSLATASNWGWNCALAFAVPPLLWTINWKMYMLFAAFNGAAFCHMFCTAPETKGKTLEEMDDVFDAGRPAWRTAPKGSRLDVLRIEIEKGARTVDAPGLATAMARVPTGGEGEGEKGEEEKGREIRVLEIV
ncbi:MFS sugar transporter [Ptychographa xylographoides]|nr:MFS sugar transporter [Ptychographa xylographoides]